MKFLIACKHSCFFSLLAARDVLPGETPTPLRQKFHTGDVKFVRNLSRALIGRRNSYKFLAIFYERQTKDKRSQRSNVNAKNLHVLQNSHICVI